MIDSITRITLCAPCKHWLAAQIMFPVLKKEGVNYKQNVISLYVSSFWCIVYILRNTNGKNINRSIQMEVIWKFHYEKNKTTKLSQLESASKCDWETLGVWSGNENKREKLCKLWHVQCNYKYSVARPGTYHKYTSIPFV